MLSRIDREYLTSPSFRQFLLDFVDEPAVFGIDAFWREIPRLSNDKANPALELVVEFGAIQRPQFMGMVGIKHKRIEHRAQDGTIAAMLFQSLPNVVFELAIRFPHLFIHRDADIALFVGWKLVGNVLKENEGAHLHQEFS